MTIADHVFIRSHSAARNYDAWIMLGYAALALVAMAAIYFAAGGPGATGAEIASAVVLP
jgi:ABC-type Co2+ transport system permease subunit